MTPDLGLECVSRGADVVLRVGGGTRQLVPGVPDDFEDTMAGGPRLVSQQLAHRRGETRDVLPQGGQIRGKISGSRLNARGHGSLRDEKTRGRVVPAGSACRVLGRLVAVVGSTLGNLHSG